MRSAPLLFCTLALAAAAAPAAENAAAAGLGAPTDSFALPAALAEISGLAPAASGRVLAHGDERAVAFEIDLASGRIVRTLPFGPGTLSGDFEGIAVAGGRLSLVTSAGRILQRPLAAGSGPAPRAVAVDTGAGRRCEIEGLAPAARPGSFLLLCKRMALKAEDGRLRIYEWSPGEALKVAVDLAAAEAAPGAKELRPSDLFRDPATGRLLVLESRNRVVIVLDSGGRPLGVLHLDRQRHPQPEALALLEDGRLVIGDEAAGGKGRIAVYRPRLPP